MSSLPTGQPIIDPHHHLWEHPTKRYMTEDLRADVGSVPGITGTVFLECASAYREEGPVAFRPVGETEFVVAADPDGFIRGIVGRRVVHAEIDPGDVDGGHRHIVASMARGRGGRETGPRSD